MPSPDTRPNFLTLFDPTEINKTDSTGPEHLLLNFLLQTLADAESPEETPIELFTHLRSELDTWLDRMRQLTRLGLLVSTRGSEYKKLDFASTGLPARSRSTDFSYAQPVWEKIGYLIQRQEAKTPTPPKRKIEPATYRIIINYEDNTDKDSDWFFNNVGEIEFVTSDDGVIFFSIHDIKTKQEKTIVIQLFSGQPAVKSMTVNGHEQTVDTSPTQLTELLKHLLTIVQSTIQSTDPEQSVDPQSRRLDAMRIDKYVEQETRSLIESVIRTKEEGYSYRYYDTLMWTIRVLSSWQIQISSQLTSSRQQFSSDDLTQVEIVLNQTQAVLNQSFTQLEGFLTELFNLHGRQPIDGRLNMPLNPKGLGYNNGWFFDLPKTELQIGQKVMVFSYDTVATVVSIKDDVVTLEFPPQTIDLPENQLPVGQEQVKDLGVYRHHLLRDMLHPAWRSVEKIVPDRTVRKEDVISTKPVTIIDIDAGPVRTGGYHDNETDRYDNGWLVEIEGDVLKQILAITDKELSELQTRYLIGHLLKLKEEGGDEQPSAELVYATFNRDGRTMSDLCLKLESGDLEPFSTFWSPGGISQKINQRPDWGTTSQKKLRQ